MRPTSTPSESNSLNAARLRSAGFSTLDSASATSYSSSSVGRISPLTSRSVMPRNSSAPTASPVPAAASAARRVNRCTAMSKVSAWTPERSAAYRQRCNDTMPRPSLSAVLAIWSPVSANRPVRPNIAAPAAMAASPVFFANAAASTPMVRNCCPTRPAARPTWSSPVCLETRWMACPTLRSGAVAWSTALTTIASCIVAALAISVSVHPALNPHGRAVPPQELARRQPVDFRRRPVVHVSDVFG